MVPCWTYTFPMYEMGLMTSPSPGMCNLNKIIIWNPIVGPQCPTCLPLLSQWGQSPMCLLPLGSGGSLTAPSPSLLSFLYEVAVPQLECAGVGKLILAHACQIGTPVFQMSPKLTLEGQCPRAAISVSARFEVPLSSPVDANPTEVPRVSSSVHTDDSCPPAVIVLPHCTFAF